MKILSQSTDQELIRHFLEGNEIAFKVLIQRHQKEIFNTVFSLVRDYNLAEDLCQDVYIRIIKSIRKGSYNEEGKFLPWALRVAHNICLDYLRKMKRTPYTKELTSSITVQYEECTDKKLLQLQMQQRMISILNNLPEEQKKVILFRHYEDMSFKEIASIMNASVNTTMGRMRYGLISLRKMIENNRFVLEQ